MTAKASVRAVLTGAFTVGTMGFGGGAALIPIMEREFVQRHRLADDETFTAHTIIANVTPGAQPVKMSAMVGTHCRQSWAPLAAALSVALPGTLGTVLLLLLFSAIGGAAVRIVEFASLGIAAFIGTLLIHYIAKVLRQYRLVTSVFIMVVTFFAVGANQGISAAGSLLGQPWKTSLPQLNAVQAILLAFVAVAVISLVKRRKQRLKEPVLTDEAQPQVSPSHRPLRAAAVMLGVCIVAFAAAVALGGTKLISLIGLSTLTSFGGGAAYIGVADGFFVSGGLVPGEVFYGQMVPVANALPGPVLIKLASAIGYGYGYEQGGTLYGVVLAGLSFVVAVTACTALALAFLAVYQKASRTAFVQALGAVVLPVICGLLIATMASMLEANVDIAAHAGFSGIAAAWASVAGVVVLWWIQRHWHLHDLILIGFAGGLSLVTLLILT